MRFRRSQFCAGSPLALHSGSRLDVNPKPAQHGPEDMEVLGSPGVHHQEKGKDSRERASGKDERICPSFCRPVEIGRQARSNQNKVSCRGYWGDNQLGMWIVALTDEMNEHCPSGLDESRDK